MMMSMPAFFFAFLAACLLGMAPSAPARWAAIQELALSLAHETALLIYASFAAHTCLAILWLTGVTMYCCDWWKDDPQPAGSTTRPSPADLDFD